MPSPSHRVLSLRCILGLPNLSSCHFCICVYTLNCILKAETKKIHFFHLPLWIFSLALRHRSTAAFSCFDRQSPLNWVTFRLNLICQKSYCRITALNIYQFSQTAGRSISLPTPSGCLCEQGECQSRVDIIESTRSLASYAHSCRRGSGLNCCSPGGAHWRGGRKQFKTDQDSSSREQITPIMDDMIRHFCNFNSVSVPPRSDECAEPE